MTTEQHGFKAETQQLLDLMIHAVYSNRDVFLRELISNAADALDKARFRGLTQSDQVPAAHEQEGIRIAFDAEARTLTIADDGIGLTRDEAIENLGTIAHSGTKAFLEQAKQAEQGDLPDLIGQFGVGFYSCFMVADQVVVDSRSADPEATGIRWTSEGAGTYAIEDLEREHRGTTITLTLREDAADYASEAGIRRIVREHSNFLSWPILLDDEQIDSGKAIWAQPPSEVSDDEANEFYKMLSFDFEDPAVRVHLKVDSPLQYSALLFVPKSRPYDLFVPEADKGPRLYAKRVLIEEHAKDLLPDWLRFVRGVVDSEDIKLNVSREMVQKTPVVRTIRDALTKRILKELGRLADADAPEEGAHPYLAVWESFGMLLKEGYFHDKAAYGDRLVPLFRFKTMNGGDDWVSLDDYRKAMPLGQDTIWYITAPSAAQARLSPHLEAFRKKGWDVVLLTEPVDEWFVQGFSEYEELPVKSVSRGELELDDETDTDAESADVDSLAPWLQEVLGDAVAGVRSSSRLTDSPAVLVDDEHGVTANMERILKAANQDVPAARRHLEVNPTHPLIVNLGKLHASGADDVATPIARLLLDDAMLLEGTVKDPAAMGKRLQEMLEAAASRAVAAG